MIFLYWIILSIFYIHPSMLARFSFSRLFDWPVPFKSSSVQLPSGDTRCRAHIHLCCCQFASVMIGCFTQEMNESVTLHTDTMRCTDVDPEASDLHSDTDSAPQCVGVLVSSDVTFTYYSTSYLITRFCFVFLMMFFFSFIARGFPNLSWLSVDIYVLSATVWN